MYLIKYLHHSFFILITGFSSKNTEVICHSLLQWATFCQKVPSWPVCLGWPGMAWLISSLSYTRLWPMWSLWLTFCDCDFWFWRLWDGSPWKNTYDKLSILKSRYITLLTKVCLVKAMVFLVVMYGCESCTIEKAEHRGINAFKLWCWRRLLRVPWTARRSSQSILKEISPEYSLEGLMLKLKL